MIGFKKLPGISHQPSRNTPPNDSLKCPICMEMFWSPSFVEMRFSFFATICFKHKQIFIRHQFTWPCVVIRFVCNVWYLWSMNLCGGNVHFVMLNSIWIPNKLPEIILWSMPYNQCPWMIIEKKLSMLDVSWIQWLSRVSKLMLARRCSEPIIYHPITERLESITFESHVRQWLFKSWTSKWKSTSWLKNNQNNLWRPYYGMNLCFNLICVRYFSVNSRINTD